VRGEALVGDGRWPKVVLVSLMATRFSIGASLRAGGGEIIADRRVKICAGVQFLATGVPRLVLLNF
jgi:hypothetical protein